jgi:hypothetical protein
MTFCPNHPQRVLLPGAKVCSLCRAETKDDGITIHLDEKYARALRYYRDKSKFAIVEQVRRALVCYYTLQKHDPEAWAACEIAMPSGDEEAGLVSDSERQ